MSDWWARKLSDSPRPDPGTRVVSAPTRVPASVNYPQTPQTVAAPSKAQSARQTDTCPGCGSGNYFSAGNSIAHRCYDCGYPLVQAGSGLDAMASEGQPTPTRQVSQGNNYQPGTIIGRIE